MDLDLNPTPELWQGAAIGIASFSLLLAAYPEINLLALTTGALLATVAVYLGTVALQSSAEPKGDRVVEVTLSGGEGSLPILESERLLLDSLDDVAPETVDRLAEKNERIEEIVDRVIYNDERADTADPSLP